MNELYENFGGLKLPISTLADGNLGLAVLDPARKVLIDLFEAAIVFELGPIWTKAVATFPARDVLSGTRPVEQRLELAPSPQLMGELKPKFPLLTCHRSGTAEYADYCIDLQRLTQPWEVNYILGPISFEGVRRVGDALAMVGKIVSSVIRQRGHIAYEDGAVQFGDGKGNLSSVALKSQTLGQAQFAGDEGGVLYYATTLNLETTELLREDENAYPVVEGASFSFGMGSPEGTIYGLVEADTDSL